MVKILSATEFNDAIKANDAQVIDVRSPQEFQGGSVSGARNIDYFEQTSFVNEFNKLDKSNPLYIFCHSGNRSQMAASVLKQMGFEEIYDLAGGYMSWPYKN